MSGTFTNIYINAYAYNDSVSFNTSSITVPIDTIRNASSHFTLTNNEITINTSALVNISFNVSSDTAVGTLRAISSAFLQIDTGSGFVVVPGTYVYMYNRQIGYGKASGSTNCILNLNSGDKLRLQILRNAGDTDLKTLGGACSITITKL